MDSPEKSSELAFKPVEVEQIEEEKSNSSFSVKIEDMLDTGRLNSKFRELKRIGEGGFGEVYMGYYTIDQKLYAIKRVKLIYSPDSENPI